MCCASSRLKGEGLNLTNVFSFNQWPAKENWCLQVLWNTLAWAGFIIAALSNLRESQAAEIVSSSTEGCGWRDSESLCFFLVMHLFGYCHQHFFLWKHWFQLSVATKSSCTFQTLVLVEVRQSLELCWSCWRWRSGDKGKPNHQGGLFFVVA